MKQLVFLIFAMTAASTGTALGQGLESKLKVSRPDFSGKWIFNYEESGPADNKLPILKNFKIYLTIYQDSTKITKSGTSDPVAPELPVFETTTYTDGRSYDLFPNMSERGFTATIAWEGAKLVTRIYDKTKKLVNRNEIELLANGRKLRLYNWHRDSLDRIFEEFSIFDRVKE